MKKKLLLKLNQYIDELKTNQKIEVESKKSFLGIETYHCFLNNGNTITRERLIKGSNDGSAVSILPITEDNKVILIVEPRVFTKSTVGIGLPAGYIEENEESKTAALRELQEEIGYIPEKLIDLGSFYQDMGCSGAYNTSFLALNCKKVSEQKLDDGEFVKYLECSYEEVLELLESGCIEGCNDIITLERAKKYIKRKI